MFKPDMRAIQQAASHGGYAAKPAKPANPATENSKNGPEIATIAGIASSQRIAPAANDVHERAAVAVRELIEAAMLACDYWGDDQAAREQMRRDCMGVPPEQRAELRDLFLREYDDGLFKQGENRDDDK